MMLKNLKPSDVPNVRREILEEQGYKCPLCGKSITESDRITLDHQHKYRKSDENGVDGNGLVRGVLCSDCNCLEGKIFNNSARFLKQPTKEQRIEWLEKLIEYYQREPYPYVHPTEVPKSKILSKKNFNKLAKEFSVKYPKKKPLEYPKSRKMTKKLKTLYSEFRIEPYN